jgi:tRNA 2-thiouridine synthesizing protein A
MKTEIDARGLSCPQPVIMARNAIKANKYPIEILLDTVTARENVKRLAESSGCKINIEDSGDEFKIELNKK